MANNDVFIIPGTGSTRLSAMLVGAPKAANQYQNCQRFPGLQNQPTGVYEFNLLTIKYPAAGATEVVTMPIANYPLK